MKIFLDTSTLFKLYHREAGTEDWERLFAHEKITAVFFPKFRKVEFTSAIWKKVRTKDITPPAAQTTLDLFESDFGKYTFVATDSRIIERARMLVTKYGRQGLRTLDSIQLSTCINLFQQVDAFFTTDKLLNTFLQAEGLPTQLPGGGGS